MRIALFTLVITCFFFTSIGITQDKGRNSEINALKEELQILYKSIEKVEERLQKLEEAEAKEDVAIESESAIAPTPAPQQGSGAVASAEMDEIPESTLAKALEDFTFSGFIAAFGQGATEVTIQDEHSESAVGYGYAGELVVDWTPLEDGFVRLKFRIGEGRGADEELEDLLFADLNTLEDDNPDDAFIEILEASYTHSFLDELLTFTIGKSQVTNFIDTNVYAGDPVTQFIGKAFVNNPVLDAENDFAPLVAL